uniref:BRCT domain-containing protein n=1 Tax=Bionectria ochroleuca TaxID=29856 RepID=A0A8H7TPX2_BIOOC
MLSEDLGITLRLRKAIEDIIVNGGGKFVTDVSECDTFICQYRDGEQFVRAGQSCKDVGNLSWLYYLIIRNEWSSPLHRLMHYPIPRNGIKGFENLRITVSNYGGEARIYLENLIKACGAEFTKTMKADNTHLITARNTSEKCRAAPEWGIAVVNHLWIEECYAKSEMKPYNIKKYNHFPLRTNLGEIIGQTFFDESRLRELYYPGGEEHMSPRAKRKRKILEVAEDNSYRHGPAEGVVIGQADKRESQRRRGWKLLQLPSDLDGQHQERKTTHHLSCPREAEAPRPRLGISCTTLRPTSLSTRRKRRGIANLETPLGGKRAADLTEKEKLEKQAHTSSPSPEEGDAEERKRPAKKARPSLPDVELRIVLTGFSSWVGDKNREDKDRRKLRDLGIQIVQEGQPCDYLAAPNIVRTVKFLCALARGPTVISSDFIQKALEDGAVPPVEDFILKDDEAEARFDMSLKRSIARAKANKGKLLQGVGIYCTEKIRNGIDSYKAIAEANGAIFKIYRARSGTTIKPTTAEEDGHAPPEPVYLISCASPEEKQMWARFKDMAQKWQHGTTSGGARLAVGRRNGATSQIQRQVPGRELLPERLMKGEPALLVSPSS